MKTHLTSEELLDLALGLRGPEGHVGRCGPCGEAFARVKEEQSALRRAFLRAEPGVKKLEDRIMDRLDDVPAAPEKSGAGFALAASAVIFFVAFLGAVAFILFMPRKVDVQLLTDQVHRIVREAEALDATGRFDESIERYEEALALIEGNDFFKTASVDFRARIRMIEMDRAALAEANREFAALQGAFERAGGASDFHDLLKEAKSLRDRAKDSDIVLWKGELQVLIEKIEKHLDTEAATNKRLDFQVRRHEIMANCKLSGDPNKALWGQAIQAWNDYLAEEIGGVSRTKASNEIRVLNNRARDSFRSVQRRVARMVESNQKSDAFALLKGEAERFKGTDSEEELNAMLRKLDR